MKGLHLKIAKIFEFVTQTQFLEWVFTCKKENDKSLEKSKFEDLNSNLICLVI